VPVPTILPNTIDAQRAKNEVRMRKRYSDPDFKGDLVRLRKLIAAGRTFDEVRDLFKDNHIWWNDLKFALASSLLNPENIMLEWQIRNQGRYQQGLKLFRMAEEQGDMEMMAKAIMMLQKIDSDDIEVKKYLGLVKPVKEVESDGEGISHDDLELAEQRWSRIIEERIAHKLEVRREAEAPVPVDVLLGAEFERQPNSVGQVAVVEVNSGGQEPGDSVPQILSNGG
jgi:hypothetical protein